MGKKSKNNKTKNQEKQEQLPSEIEINNNSVPMVTQPSIKQSSSPMKVLDTTALKVKEQQQHTEDNASSFLPEEQSEEVAEGTTLTKDASEHSVEG